MHKRKSQKRISRPNHVLSIRHGKTLVTYDKEADAAYFRVREGAVARTVKMQEWLLADLDKSGALLGVEMLFVSSHVPRKSIGQSIRRGTFAGVVAAA